MSEENGHMSIPLLPEKQSVHYDLRTGFSGSVAVLLALLIGLFAWLVEYPGSSLANDQQLGQYYMWYIHVAVMIYVGFGFLMTFLKSYSFSAVGLNFLYSSFVALAAILCVGAAKQLVGVKHSGLKIQLTMPLLIDSLFCAGASMISFGALIGKTSPFQTLWALILEVPLYAINMWLAERLGALDIGGSITIHAFGAYYGLACSLVLSRHSGSGASHSKNGAVRTSDMTAMIGTLFLFIFWPSFVGALASDPLNPQSTSQFLCVVNTILALFGSCCAAFLTSAVATGGKLDMVHIQNSTLAGGVAIGSAANLNLTPAGALAIGIGVGLISTLGYAALQPVLESSMGLRDTCGVHNLHGLPGLIGGTVAGIAAAAPSNAGLRNFSTSTTQVGHQFLAILITLCIAIFGGLIVSTALTLLLGSGPETLKAEHMYEDSVYWHEEFAEEQMQLD